MAEPEINLILLARQLERMLSELGEMRDDMRVILAMAQRLDGTVSRLMDEMRHATTS